MKSFGPSFEMTHRSDTDGEVRVIERSNRLTRVRVDNRHYDGAGACVLGLGSFDGFHPVSYTHLTLPTIYSV